MARRPSAPSDTSPQTLSAIEEKYSLPAGARGERIAKARKKAFVDGIQRAQRGYVDDVMQSKKVGESVREAQASLADKKSPDLKYLAHDGLAASAQGGVVRAHAQITTLNQYSFYPEHNQRKETKLYAQAHKKLAIDLDRPCLACGVKNSTLHDDTQNRFGARAMETHHHVVEWALANGVDAEKFFDHVVMALAHKKANNDGSLDPSFVQYYDPNKKSAWTANNGALMTAWVDHSTDNLWVLCDVHHRHKFLGIHAITDPIWGPMDVIVDELNDKGFIALAKGQTPSLPTMGGTSGRKGKKGAAKRSRKKARPSSKARSKVKRSRGRTAKRKGAVGAKRRRRS